MRIQLTFERSRTIDRASIYALVRREIYLRPMSLDDMVDKIVDIVEAVGVQVVRKDLSRSRREAEVN